MRVLHVGRAFRPLLNNGLLEYVEDLMDIQVAQGYKVAYFFSGRHYPFLRNPWLKKWLRKDIRMYEIINSPIFRGHGTTYPETDLNEEYSEKFFIKTLSEFKPDIIHIQDLFGLPSSLIDIAKLKGIPIMMTLHDYFPLCPTSRLFDYNYSLCSSHYVGNKCVLCCAEAPANANHLIEYSLRFEKNRLKLAIERWLPKKINVLKIIKNLAKTFKNFTQNTEYSLRKSDELIIDYSCQEKERLEKVFQKRRDTNIERLNKVDLVVAQSFRTSEIYQLLGIKANKITTIHSNPKHLVYLKPKLIESVTRPINFVTMNGCASVEKGGYLILDAIRQLRKLDLNSQFRLFLMGDVFDSVRNELLGFDNVVYKGPYRVNDLDSLLEGMHVGLVPSIWEEVYGYVGIEFIAKGIPVIGNNLGGIVEYTIDNVTGWVNKANSAEGLAQIMANIIYNPNQILDLNRSIISNYARIIKPMERHFEEVDKIYEGLIQARNEQKIELGASKSISY